MDEGRTERARQILQAIDNGNLPVEDIRRRLFAMAEEELSGPLDREYDKVKVELCESLLWESMTDGETPLPDFERSKAAVAKKYEARKRRGRILAYGLRIAAAVLLLFSMMLISAFALSSEFRESVMKLFVTTYETHSVVGMGTTNGADVTATENPVKEYRLAWLPNDRYAIIDSSYSIMMSSVTYSMDDGAWIALEVCGPNVLGNVDTEGMQSSILVLDGRELHLFHGERHSVVIWQEGSSFFVLSAWAASDAEILLMALSVTPLGE